MRRATRPGPQPRACWRFLSTLSLRRATALPYPADRVTLYFYPRSPCGERRAANSSSGKSITISIHALLAESDASRAATTSAARYFYPRSPCGERLTSFSLKSNQTDFYPRSPCGERPNCWPQTRFCCHFYPRSPCGERLAGCAVLHGNRDFYPRSPCGERRLPHHHPHGGGHISIHALLAESDWKPSAALPPILAFLSTLSLRRATPK